MNKKQANLSDDAGDGERNMDNLQNLYRLEKLLREGTEPVVFAHSENDVTNYENKKRSTIKLITGTINTPPAQLFVKSAVREDFLFKMKLIGLCLPP